MDHSPKFVISSSDAESLASKSNLTSVLQLLPTLVYPAQSLARPPISDFSVAAVGYGSSGRIFLGVNLEFPGLPLNNSVHAEQFLVTNMYLNSESTLRCFAVSAPPCGHCRQFLQEVRNAGEIEILITSVGNDYDVLSSFLPHRFGPDDLLDKDVPLLLDPRDNGLRLIENLNPINGLEKDLESNSITKANLRSKGCPKPYKGVRDAEHLRCEILTDREEELKATALEAANKSYAPYSESPSGVALMDVEGRVYRGSYIESAAYNPSLGPVQAAIVAYVAENSGGYERIVAAVLVEKEEGKIKQEDTARLLLKSVSPKCEFKVFHCFSSAKL